MGYHRAGFEVVGVDIEPQPHYPFEFHQADALEYLANHYELFDAFHGSPPCQKFMSLNKLNEGRKGYKIRVYPNFIPETRRLMQMTGKPFVIENVQGAPLNTQFILCGHSLGLVHLARHRHFESNVFVPRIACTHRGQPGIIGVYGDKPDGRRVSHPQYRMNRVASSINEAKAAMGINWMTWRELTQAIPPAYTEYIGRYLLAVVRSA